MSFTLPWVLLLPLFAATASFLMRRMETSLRFLLTLLQVALIAVLFSLWTEVLRSGPQRIHAGGWLPPLGISLRADGLSVLFLTMAGLIFTVCGFYANAYFSAKSDSVDKNTKALFWPLWFFLWTSINGLFVSADVFNAYVLLELMSLSSVALVSLTGETPALVAGIRYLVTSLLGSLTYLLGIAILYANYGVLDLQMLGRVVESTPSTWIILSLMTTGLMLKTAMFPLHFWLPQAHANAPTPVSAVLSALVIKATFFLILRLWFGGGFKAVHSSQAGILIGALGSVAIIWGSLQALRQKRLKLLIAYSTVAQIGYFFLIFPILTQSPVANAWTAGIYLMLAHGFAKAAMFLTAGVIITLLGTDEITRFSGLAQRSPGTTLAFALAGISLIGLPPSGGFVGKWYLLMAVIEGGQWIWVPFILAGGLLAFAYVFKVLWYMFLNSEDVNTDKTSLRLVVAAFALAFAAIMLGFRATDALQLIQVGSPFPTQMEGN